MDLKWLLSSRICKVTFLVLILQPLIHLINPVWLLPAPLQWLWSCQGLQLLLCCQTQCIILIHYSEDILSRYTHHHTIMVTLLPWIVLNYYCCYQSDMNNFTRFIQNRLSNFRKICQLLRKLILPKSSTLPLYIYKKKWLLLLLVLNEVIL